MPEFIFQTVYHLFKSSPDQWELEEIDEYFQFFQKGLEPYEIDFDVYVDNFDLKKEFIKNFDGKEGYIYYYSEFNVHGFQCSTMDGTEYDEEYEIIKDESRWLGGEEWNKENFIVQKRELVAKEERVDRFIEKLNTLIKQTDSLMQANKNNYNDVLRYLLENYPILLKNKMPEVYNLLWVNVNLADVEHQEYWNRRF